MHPNFKFFLVLSLSLLFHLLLLWESGLAQIIEATSPAERNASIRHHQQMRDSSVFRDYPVRSVGPVVMSGRITDLAVTRENPAHFFVAYASGGVFETTNSGNTLTPVFDHQGALTIGDIAISRADRNTIWVGTGENNSSRSSYAGTGVYVSRDGGKTWQFANLGGSHHIGRIITHPSDADIAWVASMGPLYSINEVRGVYKTTDGGESWTQTLIPPDSTGVIDLVIHPDNPDTLWAATWQRFRNAWDFRESGPGSAIYLSADGGSSWQQTIKGFPQGRHVGRIGLGVSRTDPDILYALLDNQNTAREEKKEETGKLTLFDLLQMSREQFLELDTERLEEFLREYGFPEKYSAQRVKNEIRKGIYEPRALAEYLGDANRALFDTEVTGAEVYRSDDAGGTWRKVNNYSLDNFYFTYGYYFGEVRISPADPDIVYILGVPLLRSEDGGKTWTAMAENQPVHVDHHALWLDPNDPEHLLLGNDGGLYESHDGGENFIRHNVAPVGQFYSVNVDMEQPYNIYGGLQDNGVFTGSSRDAPHDENHWEQLLGGDGMHVAVDPRDSRIVYTGYQFGNYFRINRAENTLERITPMHDIGEERYRYNWNTPLNMSHHNSDILYIGSQRLNRSLDRGETWTPISPDLTNERLRQQSGDVPYSTITTIAESPLAFNVIWVGTDDGRVQVTRNGGASWNRVSGMLPDSRWVSEVHASVHDVSTAYVSLNGYRNDEFRTYIFKTSDFGKNWKPVNGNLPEDVVNVVVEDPQVPGMLYAGLDSGSFASFDDGEHWYPINGIPNAASYDMVVHPRDLELVIATHGRSIYVMDLKPLHRVAARRNRDIVAIAPDTVSHSEAWGDREAPYREVIEPEVQWLYWIGNNKVRSRKVEIEIRDRDDNTVSVLETYGHHGFNIFRWNLATSISSGPQKEPSYLPKGQYNLIFKTGNYSDEVPFTVQ